MDTIDTLVVGAGHAGLAVSHLLSRAGREHVVLDRGRVAESWRSERWDSLHLLTPRWMTRMPGWWHDGPDQDGFMPAAELVRHLEQYAAGVGPLALGEQVLDVSYLRGDYLVRTTNRTWRARNVVLATGPGRPRLPQALDGLGADVHVMHAAQYRNPERLPAGGVLVVGASASGTQVADELARAGRKVVLAVGSHTRVPRRYRGMDVFWWLEQTGRLARSYEDRAGESRPHPSPQLVGRAENDPRGPEVDLPTLQALGVELAGRVTGARRHSISLATDLAATTGRAEARLSRLLDSFDEYAAAHHLTSELDPADRPRAVEVGRARHRLDLRSAGIRTVVMATGYTPHHPWLRVPVVGSDGRVQQVRGVTAAPGLYVVGQPFHRRKDTPFLDGARHAALEVVTHLCTRHAGSTAAVSPS